MKERVREERLYDEMMQYAKQDIDNKNDGETNGMDEGAASAEEIKK